ncbi:MAG TPA: response regulator transcription factor [Opitutaceae bacterium]|nr:response regulator transcription factor [Opitutaceae bacterium]
MSASPAIKDSRRRRVFVVDDHPLVREWLINLIQRRGDLEVCGEAEDAATARAAMARARPDIVIVDLSLKNGSGLDLIKDLRVQHPAVRILVLSMHEDASYAERALRAGARGYVMKRESTGQIIEAIHEVLRGGVYASPKLLAGLAERIVDDPARKSGTRSPADLLSDRELEVFRLLGGGLETRRVAGQLNLSIKTVQCYAARIKEKLGLNNASELMREAVRWADAERRH